MRMQGHRVKHQQNPSEVIYSHQLNQKPKFRWTPKLHALFEEAVHDLGGARAKVNYFAVATPRAIYDKMEVDVITLRQVKSHLQKYRDQMENGKNGRLIKRRRRPSNAPDTNLVPQVADDSGPSNATMTSASYIEDGQLNVHSHYDNNQLPSQLGKDQSLQSLVPDVSVARSEMEKLESTLFPLPEVAPSEPSQVPNSDNVPVQPLVSRDEEDIYSDLSFITLSPPVQYGFEAFDLSGGWENDINQLTRSYEPFNAQPSSYEEVMEALPPITPTPTIEDYLKDSWQSGEWALDNLPPWNDFGETFFNSERDDLL